MSRKEKIETLIDAAKQHGKFLSQENRYPFHGFKYHLFENWMEWERGEVSDEDE